LPAIRTSALYARRTLSTVISQPSTHFVNDLPLCPLWLNRSFSVVESARRA